MAGAMDHGCKVNWLGADLQNGYGSDALLSRERSDSGGDDLQVYHALTNEWNNIILQN